MCGERAFFSLLTVPSVGSSPRVRGTARPRPRASARARFIPACAGNGRAGRFWLLPLPVHPRVCGERRRDRGGLVDRHGSSPRVRGTVSRLGRAAPRPRFIPACAGNGYSESRMPRSTAVHPRVCGERCWTPQVVQKTYGSSPRVRGTARPQQPPRRGNRFIPACAGNGSSAPTTRIARPVHPRVCGERLESTKSWDEQTGSSPRVRGTGGLRRALMVARRFIPACAGNGRARRSNASWSTVHPRVCGERVIERTAEDDAAGSSPRVRGTVATLDRRGCSARFIPACAGNGL